MIQRPLGQQRPSAGRVERLDIGFEPHQRPNEEAHHHKPVGHGNGGTPHQLGVEKHLLEHLHPAAQQPIRAAGCGLTSGNKQIQAAGGANE